MRSKAPGEDPSSPILFPPSLQETEDEDVGDVGRGVDEDALDADEIDTDQITATP